MIEIILEGQPLSLIDNPSVLITRSIADIREPQARASEWSKTVEIPGTKNNNKIFSHLFEVEQTVYGTSFNPNVKADCIVYSDGVEQLRGFLRLLSIKVDDSTHITYEVSLHGQTSDLFTTLSERKLNALDFSEYNHTLSSGNIIDSWATQIYKNGAYQSFAYGSGYVYSMLDKGHPRNISLWEANEFTPCLYAKTIVDKMFSEAYYTYSADSFFNSTRFKRLVIPSPSTLTVSAAALEARRFKASRITSAQSLDLGSTLVFQNDSTSGNYDNGSNYNTTSGGYTIPVGGDYVFDVNLDIDFSTTAYIPTYTKDIWLVFGLYVNGVKRNTATVTVDNGSPTFSIDFYFSPSTLYPGDVVDFRLVQVYDEANQYNLTNSQFQILIGVDSFIESNSTAYTYGYGETVDFSTFLNTEVKQSELLMSFVKMFNLYIEADRDNPKELRIVPRDEFYNGSQVDWTYKLDYSQPVEIVPMGELDANPYVFAYKDGKDAANTTYQELYQTSYGSRTYQVENQFVKNEKKIDIVFAPSQIRSYNGQKNFVLSYVPDSKDGDLRILYYSGLVSGVNWMLYPQYAGVGFTRSNQYSIPLTIHLDSISDPTFDINFGMPREVGLGAGYKYTNSNLVNNYYYKFLTEVTGNNSKILRAYFRITLKDWLNLSFSDSYFFEGQYWRLNKIEDYNPAEDGVFMCEFLLAQFIQPATITQKTIGAGTGGGQSEETYGDIYPGGNNPFKPGIKGVSVGSSDGGSGIFVGDNIIQSNNNDNTTALASTNVSFLEGADNSIAIGCQDFEVIEPNKVYIKNYEFDPSYLQVGGLEIGSQWVFVNTTADLPAPVSGVITLLPNITYVFTGVIDLDGDRIVCGQNTTLLGGSSENCRIKSTGLTGTALITSVYSLPIRNLTIEASIALNLDGDASTTAIDWFGVNFTDCTTVGTIRDYTNVILSDCAFLNSAGLTFDGTIGTVGMNQSLFDGRSSSTTITLASTLTISRRFRIIYSSFVCLSGETALNVSTSATIPVEGYILDTINFSGGGTYISGVQYNDNKALFSNCKGINNSSQVANYYMGDNTTPTIIVTVDVPVKVAGTTTSNSISQRFTFTDNRATYTGAITRIFKCTAVSSVTANNNNKVVGLYFYKNGSILTESEMYATTNAAYKAESIAIQTITSLSENDYLEVWVENKSDDGDITVTFLNVIIEQVN